MKWTSTASLSFIKRLVQKVSKFCRLSLSGTGCTSFTPGTLLFHKGFRKPRRLHRRSCQCQQLWYILGQASTPVPARSTVDQFIPKYKVTRKHISATSNPRSKFQVVISGVFNRVGIFWRSFKSIRPLRAHNLGAIREKEIMPIRKSFPSKPASE